MYSCVGVLLKIKCIFCSNIDLLLILIFSSSSMDIFFSIVINLYCKHQYQYDYNIEHKATH